MNSIQYMQVPHQAGSVQLFMVAVGMWARAQAHGAIDLSSLRFLFQGRDPTIDTCYDQLPYRLALLKLDRSSKKGGSHDSDESE